VNPSLRDMLASGEAFQGYAYAYPHKTAYRRLEPRRSLRSLWAPEDRHALFLYCHVPFCEMRCGFCNLFTATHPGGNLVAAYLDALERQAGAVAGALGEDAQFARLALGGGTPTFLSVAELERLFSILNRYFLRDSDAVPKAVEASPATVDDDKIALLKAQRVTRVSLGVQSFLEAEVRTLGRAQRTQEVRGALGKLAGANFPCLNVDLIYGIEGQTPASWRHSLDEALEFAPQELYLYPLYVRPLTGLDRLGREPADGRLELYRRGRDFLRERGYRQISMRLFRREDYAPPEGPVYCCQEDGMVGLGAGARSYTSALHYSTEYAVGRSGVLEIIEDYNRRRQDDFAYADYGCELDREEQQRRYLLKSLLRQDGLDPAAYRNTFASDPFTDFPQLNDLLVKGLAIHEGTQLRPTAEGLEWSDVIGPWLWSAAVREKMNDFALK
jgi:oxygen-independent coproporphyrinogen-3 oxidase